MCVCVLYTCFKHTLTLLKVEMKREKSVTRRRKQGGGGGRIFGESKGIECRHVLTVILFATLKDDKEHIPPHSNPATQKTSTLVLLGGFTHTHTHGVYHAPKALIM